MANPCDLVKVRMIGDGMAAGGGAPRMLHGIGGSLVRRYVTAGYEEGVRGPV